MKEETSYTVYEAIDFIKNNMTPEQLADYLWMNYPHYADDLRHYIEARLYLEAISMQPNEYD